MLEYVRDYVVQEKEILQNPNTKDSQVLPYQSSDFIVASRKDQLFEPIPDQPALFFIPLSQKLSLHKNKKKRQGLTAQEIKRSFIDD